MIRSIANSKDSQHVCVFRHAPVSTAIWAYQQFMRDSLFQRVLESAYYANVRPWAQGLRYFRSCHGINMAVRNHNVQVLVIQVLT
jgi:hypothetical protein